MKNNFSNIIQYFKSCYQADARDVQLMNFFSKKIEDSFLLKDSDLLTGKSLLYPVDSEWGERTQKTLSIYGKEKELYAFSLFLLGKYTMIGRSQRVAAPLILHPLELKEIDEVYYLSIKEGNHIYNPFFFQLANSEGSSAEAKEEMYEKSDNDFIQFDDCVFISDIVKKHFSNINAKMLPQFPDLLSGKDVWSLLRKQKGDRYRLVPAAGVGLMKKSFGNVGIYSELDEISENPLISAPIDFLFGNTKRKASKRKESTILAPVLLSHAQAEICRNAENDLSVIVGPPGTGKSFTVAALACDAVARGKSVLITSKNDQAVNVILNKIEEEMGLPDLSVRAGRKDYLKQLKFRIEELFYFQNKEVRRNRHLKIRYDLEDLHQSIISLEKEILIREQNEVNQGKFLNDRNVWFFEWKKRRLEKRHNKEKQLDQLFLDYQEALSQRNRLIQEHLEQQMANSKENVLAHDYQDLKKFLQAIKARTGAKREALFNEINLPKIFKAFPIWLVNFKDIHKVVHMEEELFDLVIIDEASQCDIASALPILQRGKKAVIVGDSKQLKHISFLSGNEQEKFRQKLNLKDIPDELLDYRNRSILDLALEKIEDRSQVQSLNEHYRSQPDIISFSNKTFYGNQLKIMTSNPTTNQNKNLFLCELDGTRNKNGSNNEEAEAILTQVLSIIKNDEGVDEHLCHSIGILSPFRGQVEFLQKKMDEKLSLSQIEKHDILVGTPHSFQGEEWDVMFISFTIDEKTSTNVIRYIEKPDVLNVSITRAKNKQYVFISCPLKSISSSGLFYQYIASINSSAKALIPTRENIKDQFMSELVAELKILDLDKILVHHQIASLDLDIVIVNEGKTKVIDLIGYPGAYEGVYHLEYYRMLTRVGIAIHPVSYSDWIFNKTAIMKTLKHFIQL